MEKRIKTHKDLEVLNTSMDLVADVYKLTKDFPSEEKFSLVNQMRRAAVSIHGNIAEGAGRTSSKEFSHFLSIAMGSTCELETQFILSRRLGFLEYNKELDSCIIRIKLMLKD
ncbi:MAG: four helix bundle protein [Bacteroidota bacterium]